MSELDDDTDEFPAIREPIARASTPMANAPIANAPMAGAPMAGAPMTRAEARRRAQAGAPAAPRSTPQPRRSRTAGKRLAVGWPACKAHGLCHELLPEAVELDEWGYPVVAPGPLRANQVDAAKKAVRACPTLALRLLDLS